MPKCPGLLSWVLLIMLFFAPRLSLATPTEGNGLPSLTLVDSSVIISGFVRDSSSGETITGASVSIRSTRRGTITNRSGYYSLHVPANQDLQIEAHSLGYRRAVRSIHLKAGERLTIDFLLSSENLQGEEVTVESDRERERQEPQVSRVNITPKQLLQLPKAGESDLFRLLQLLPGVQTASEISSGLYIRGGSPDQNLILLDGSVLYNPSHFFGFFSSFNSDAIKGVELYKGGFPVEYGGRLSAVLSVTDKDGDRNHTKGILSLGIISSHGEFETPVGSGALSVSGRRTYIDVILKATGLQASLDLPNYNFYDLNAKIVQNPSENDKISLSGYGGSDKLDFESDKAASAIGVNWGNSAGALEWTHVFASDLFSKFDGHYSHYFNNLSAGLGNEGFTWTNSIYDYTLNGSLEYFYRQQHQFKLGFQATAYQFKFIVATADNPPSASFDLRPLYGALYLQDEWKPRLGADSSDPLAVTAGVRVDGISAKKSLAFDPRISARYIINPALTLKASVGIYHQYLKLATNPTLSFFDVWLPVDSTQESSRAIQYVLGVSTLPFQDYQFDVETYYKPMTNLVEIRPNIVRSNDLRDIFFVGSGVAYGVEFFLQKQTGDLTGWLGYTLAWVRRTFPDINNGTTFPPTYDRRNDLDLVLSYKINDRWTVGSTLVYQTGQAYSQVTALAPYTLPDDPGFNVAIPGDKNALRLPPYNRLDLSGTYSFSLFSEKRNALLDIDIYNAYNYRNVWISRVDRSTNPATIGYVRLLPILPTLTLTINFN